MNLLIGRSNAIKFLDRSTKMSSAVVVAGCSGVGKTYLVRQWLKMKGLSADWISVGKYESFKSLLAGSEGQKAEVIVWDDYQNFPPKERQQLWTHLSTQSSNSLHILIGDEAFLPKMPMSLPSLKLQPFDMSEFSAYLQEFSEELDENRSLAVYQETAGLPLYINLWLQGVEIDNENILKKISEMSSAAQDIFEVCAFLERKPELSFLEQTLEHSLETLNLALKELQEHFFVQDGEIPKAFATLFLKNKKSEDYQDFLKRLPEKNGDCSLKTHLFVLAIRSESSELMKRLADYIDIESIDTLKREALVELQEGLKSRMAEMKSLENVRLLRLFLRSLIITGKRDEAAQFGLKNFEENYSQHIQQEEVALLVLDIVQCLSRIYRTSDALELCQKNMNKISGVTQVHLLIELAVLISRESTDESYRRALDALKRALSKLAHQEEQMGEQREIEKAKALVHFEMARLLDTACEASEADHHYQNARRQFAKVEDHYMASVALLNQTWIALKEQVWIEFDSLIEELYETAGRYGYQYILSGADLLKAKQERFFLQREKALIRLESSQERLTHSAPLAARYDIYVEKARLLIDMGQRVEAEQVCAEISQMIQKSGSPVYTKEWKNHQKELSFYKCSYEDFVQGYELAETGVESHYQKHLLASRLLFELPASSDALKNYPLGKMRICENKLIRKMAENPDDIWQELAELEKVLSHVMSPMEEKVALRILQSQVSRQPSEKKDYLQEARLELHRWNCDREVKYPLLAWIEGLQKNISPNQSSYWQRASVGDQERWQAWWRPFFKVQEPRFRVFTHLGVNDSLEAPAIDDEKEVFINENMGEVFFKGASQKDFQRRPLLRKLLALFLESAPQELSKSVITAAIWGENYEPEVHDPRIYTNIQRLRKLLSARDIGSKKSTEKLADPIQNWQEGYRWNPRVSYALVQEIAPQAANPTRLQALILRAFQAQADSFQSTLSRRQLVEITGSSEASVKRAVSELLQNRQLERHGLGRSVTYSLPIKKVAF